jgi:MFS family permease
VIMVSDLARGTGRFNFIQGGLNTGVSIGASISNLMTGFIVKRAGYHVGFVVLAMIAAVALASLLFAMPETRDSGGERDANRVDRNRNHGRADGAAAAQGRP